MVRLELFNARLHVGVFICIMQPAYEVPKGAATPNLFGSLRLNSWPP
uniref:Uncharacterized protein n=1 Tax=Rhizophora mucronata TaxID=61149 RepID=A0A2P2N359_RHIMU